MRKFNFYYLIAMVGAIVLSMSSCTKDLENDIDDLKKEVAANKSAIAALDQAIKAGKLITAVNPVTDGFDVVFSDNTKITVKHGNGGTAGTDGFAPIVGVDADGYWTVVTTKGGTPVRIKDATGADVLAKAVETANVKVGEDGFLYIDDVKTDVGNMPSVLLNEAQGNAVITMWDGTEMKSFTVLLNGALDGMKSMIRSIDVPVSNISVILRNGVVAKTLTGGPFDGAYTKGQIITSGGVLPVVVNPTHAMLPAKENVSIINVKGDALPFTIESIERGYTGSSFETVSRAVPATGLWSINLKATVNTAEEYNQAALKVKITDDEIVQTSYDYQIVTAPAEGIAYGSVVTPVGRAIGKTIQFAGKTAPVAIGRDEHVLQVTNPDAVLKAKVVFVNPADEVAYGKYFIFGDDGSITTLNDQATHIALNNKKIKFAYIALDYNGASIAYPNGTYASADAKQVEINFNSIFDKDVYTLTAVNHELTIDDVATATVNETVKYVDLDELYNQINRERESLWRENATALTIKFYDAATGLTENALIKGRILKADKSNVAENGTDYPRFIEVTFDPAKVLPGNFIGVMTYSDGRAQVLKFETKFNVNVTNPAIESILGSRVPAYFEGDNAVLYGTTKDVEFGRMGDKFTVTTAQSDINSIKFDLAALYNNIITPGNFVFTFTPATASVTSPYNLTINKNMLYNEYDVSVQVKMFNNAGNLVEVDKIKVTAKSEIAEGSISVSEDLSVLAGMQDKVEFNGTNVVTKDVYGQTVRAFGYYDEYSVYTRTFDPRIGSIKVEVDAEDPNASLVEVIQPTRDGKWAIQSTRHSAVTRDTKIAIKVTVTDKLGQSLVKNASITVKPSSSN